MIRLALLLIASCALFAAEKPSGRSFLMLGGLTQIVDASGKATWKYPAATRDGYILANGNLLLTLSKGKTYPGGAVVEVTRDQKIVWEYKQHKHDGSATSTGKAGWDLRKNVAV